MYEIGTERKEKLIRLSKALLSQENARVIIPPMQNAAGFWFGAGNMIEDEEGNFYLSGRYRNAGDSRTGLRVGERGVELAIFKSTDRGETFGKILSFSKKALSYGDREVISTEGSCLNIVEDGVELYISSEKKGIPYTRGFEEFQKPGTGVWSIDFMKAGSVEELASKKPRSLLESRDPLFFHVKDPVVFSLTNGDTIVLFCTHPFTWASSNSGFAIRPEGSITFKAPVFNFFSRGYSWDVAINRITGVLRIPQVGAFRDLSPISLFFYDGGESMRPYEEHPQAAKRPRGYSCEELGGLAWGVDEGFPKLERLSPSLPLFTSPYGTGCSRYVQTLRTREGVFAFWQQSQNDCSQPLVTNFLSSEEIIKILS